MTNRGVAVLGTQKIQREITGQQVEATEMFVEWSTVLVWFPV